MAVRERMEEVQRKTSAKTQATQSEGSRGQEPTTSCRRAPGQDCVSVRSQELLLQVLSTKIVEVFTLPREGLGPSPFLGTVAVLEPSLTPLV